MPIPVTMMTAEEARRIRDNEPTFSDRTPGVNLPSLLNAFAAAVAAEVGLIISDVATVANGATTEVVAVGAALNGKPVQCTFAEAPTAATIVSASIAAGDLTITIDQDNTADLDIFYQIDGR